MACRLHIKICEAKKVLKMDLGGKSDPYVTLRLKSQDKKDVQKTQIISNTRDPIWNQEFDIVAVDPNDVLLINMYDEDIKNDDIMMDQLEFPVNTWPVGGPLDRKELDIKLKKKNAGKFIFEVQAFPAEGFAVSERAINLEQGKESCRVHIKAFDAKDVLKMDLGGKSDPYLRFRFKGKKADAVKTQIISNTRNPIWNQELDIISTDRNADILEVDMLDEDIKNDDYMMDRISLPLSEHPYGTHYTFDNDIKLKKKKAGHLHFELDFLPLDSTPAPEPVVQTREVQLDQTGPAERCRVRVKAIKGENLLKMDDGISSDPFVTMQIKGQPEYTKMRTKTVDANINPVWEQEYTLDCPDRNKDVLLVNLFDEDINKDDQMMDQLEFPLNQWPIGTHIDFQDPIKYKDQDAGKLYLGIDVIEPGPEMPEFTTRDLLIEPEENGQFCDFTLGNYPSTFSTDFTGYTNWSHSLSPLNSADIRRHHHHDDGTPVQQTRDIQLETKATKVGESIKGVIVKANGLPKTDSDGSDTYVKLTVISSNAKDKKADSVKTDIIHDTQDPVWNKEFEFPNARTSDSLRAKVYQYHKVLGDQCIACVEVSLNDLKENAPIEQAFKLDKPPKVPKVVKKVVDFGTLTLNIVHNVVYQ